MVWYVLSLYVNCEDTAKRNERAQIYVLVKPIEMRYSMKGSNIQVVFSHRILHVLNMCQTMYTLPQPTLKYHQILSYRLCLWDMGVSNAAIKYIRIRYTPGVRATKASFCWYRKTFVSALTFIKKICNTTATKSNQKISSLLNKQQITSQHVFIRKFEINSL